MEKYGTPDFKNEEEGMVKVSTKKLKPCCKKVFATLKPGQSTLCFCGNDLVLEDDGTDNIKS
jgi:hypothetical protein